MTVFNEECKMYKKYLRNDESESFYEIDKNENSFAYDRKDTVYEWKNGKFVFKTINSNPYEMFEICKNEIEKFRSEIEHLFD